MTLLHATVVECRALKLFFVLRMYGAEKLRAYIRHHIALAAQFAQLIQNDDRFELAAPPRFGLVCFRCVPNVHFTSMFALFVKLGSSNRLVSSHETR